MQLAQADADERDARTHRRWKIKSASFGTSPSGAPGNWSNVYSDAGISGAKSRNGRPGLDSLLKDASRRKFDIVMAWAIDRRVRSCRSARWATVRHGWEGPFREAEPPGVRR